MPTPSPARIMDQPKPESGTTKGKKRIAPDNDTEDGAPEASRDNPSAKDVRPSISLYSQPLLNHTLTFALDQARFQRCRKARVRGDCT